MVVMVAAVWLCVRVRAADGLSAVGVCAGLGVGCRALRWAPVASGGGVRVAHVFGACSGRGVPVSWCLPCVCWWVVLVAVVVSWVGCRGRCAWWGWCCRGSA